MSWDPADDEVAQRGFALCDKVLGLVGDRAEALVACGRGTNALTRFANSRIHQNMASDDAHARLRQRSGEAWIVRDKDACGPIPAKFRRKVSDLRAAQQRHGFGAEVARLREHPQRARDECSVALLHVDER